MKLVQAHVENYRNLPDVTVYLDQAANYLIGENNIGKSNFVDALHTLLCGGSIADSDYLDDEKPIQVELIFALSPWETPPLGKARDGRLHIRFAKKITDYEVCCHDVGTGKPIPLAALRFINFFRDNAAASTGCKGDYSSSMSAFLMHLIRRRVQSPKALLHNETLVGLLGELNEQLGRLKAFSDFGIHADIQPDAASMLSRLIYLMDESSLPMELSGDGVHYTAMAMMNIVNRILTLYGSKSTPLDSVVYRTAEGHKLLPMIFALDEPEVHLHPYMQRSLIRYYKRIMSNEDEAFLQLLKTAFDLDGLDGQLLIITHSSEALIDNFRHLVRFYKDSHGRTRTACGPDMKMGADIEKHLIMQFPDIKEAFYARCALLVEGATENSALRLFAETLHVSLDDLGVSVIDGGGEGSLRKLDTLLGRFGIPCVLVFDGDVRREEESRPNEFYTRTLCFETEIVASLCAIEAYDVLDSIAIQMDPQALQRPLTYAYLEKALQKFGQEKIRVPRSLSALRRNGSDFYQTIYAAWLYKNKGAILGRIIGNTLHKESIPACYQDALLRAKALALGSRRKTVMRFTAPD